MNLRLPGHLDREAEEGSARSCDPGDGSYSKERG